ncbi:hypothetical protein SKAU_G00003790 [Synaphobranchus kaupii]|uniref:Uncharacterized protein n=1 Tax=Synaphobranchus kaupii TaxID=118154 RepID=A0A9Q1JAJ5_SYNKA|nr:hypothetical protein SKAU_G00003790 [Synaphobranchus kaupii]
MVMTGLHDDTIRADLKPFSQDPHLRDEVLLEKMDIVYTLEMEWKTQCPITANSIVSLLLSNGCFPNADNDFTRTTSTRVHELHRAPGCDSNLSNDFTTQEIELTIQ